MSRRTLIPAVVALSALQDSAVAPLPSVTRALHRIRLTDPAAAADRAPSKARTGAKSQPAGAVALDEDQVRQARTIAIGSLITVMSLTRLILPARFGNRAGAMPAAVGGPVTPARSQ